MPRAYPRRPLGNARAGQYHRPSAAQVCYKAAVRALLPAAIAALVLAASASADSWPPSAAWLAQGQCIHLREGPWTANTGNGYFGGMQFSAQTWKRVGGSAHPAFTHPGDPRFPFTVSASEQLRRAYRLWQLDGRTWRSWGAIGAACSRARG